MTTESPTLTALAKLSSAEEIFAFLGIEPIREVLNSSRLHIMKRFGAYLRETDMTGLSEEAILTHARDALTRAQGDFVASSPLKEKVFKVFETQAAKQKARFVGLETLKVIKS
ncbi:nitrogenase-stabilizing/protective protein [Rhodobacter viridis]|uniref:Nitrogenase-stabilizing/protective protein NifW n=1 Tax=Rhodobacter viridis TaxID=1054202 RepID=A0A318TS50_9RHOB|nr:nitrogenase stabilizing/protective protein NifW [Rhodobacter viridis]PYF07676.1 nitrogenase-stabilizing/protective protein [Rhodobacter viridis]